MTLVGTAEGLIVRVEAASLYTENTFVYDFEAPFESLAMYLSVYVPVERLPKISFWLTALD